MFNVHFKSKSICCLLPVVYCLLLSSCQTVDLYEKTVSLPGHEWKSGFKPAFSFTIKDTNALYQPYFVIRHTEKYNYTNIWINFYYQLPGDTLRKEKRELQMATNEKGWLASGMNDVYEHRIALTDKPVRLKAGDYKFMLENIMREDPLQQVLNIGIYLEKK